MSEKLFNPVQEGHDPQGRPVFICQSADGYYIYKPRTGFTSKAFKKVDDKALLEVFEYQKGCSQNNAFYRRGDQTNAKVVKHPSAKVEEKAVVKPLDLPSSVPPDAEIYTV